MEQMHWIPLVGISNSISDESMYPFLIFDIGENKNKHKTLSVVGKEFNRVYGIAENFVGINCIYY